MQQRGPNTTMESDNEGNKTSPPSSRGRHNSKLKYLVRSHAMREETSPPREPSPPSIQVIPTTETISLSTSPPPPPPSSLSPIVVLSPSRNSPICISPTSTLVPSPTNLSRSSSQQQQQQQYNPCCSSPTYSLNDDDDDDVADDIEDTSIDDEIDPKYLSRIINNNNNKHMERESSNSNNNNINSNKKDNTSHIHNNINNKKKIDCDCSNESCIKCTKNNNNNNNSTNINNNNVGSSNTLTVNRIGNKRMKQQSNSQPGSFEGSSSNSPCLSRDGSCEQQQYTDTSGTNLEQFIPETLNRNAKDRAFMLRIEQELVSLAKDKVKTHFKFPPMSSYQRMLVHRCAAYFGMEHNIESSGKCVVVNKTKNTRIPDKEFKEHVQDDIVFNEEPPRRSILKRDSNSMEDYSFKSPDRQFNSSDNRRSKSFEEREEEYEKVRRRIFNRELLRQMHDGTHSNDDFEWAEIQWSNSSDSDSSRFRLQLPEQQQQHRRHTGKLIKVLSEETGETLRPYVAKSYSFGGYGTGLSRGDSVVSTHSAGPRLLTKQDSGASSVSWRLSPSSSGYKSQSQMSESVTPSPTSTPHLIGESSSRQDSAIGDDNNKNNHNGQESIVWAVTDIQSVPKGSIIINPQTGEPIKNEDGSLYHYDPNNPPPGITATATTLKPPPSPKKKTNSPQRTNSNNNNNNNNNGNNERSQSPINNNNNNNSKKRSSKYSPNRKSHVTNSSTSPSLPYSPPLPVLQQQRSFQHVENLPPQYPIYSPTVQSGPVPDSGSGVTVYQQPCIVYTTPYGVPVSPHFDGRMEPSVPEMGTTYYVGIPENTTTYQQPTSTYWNQQPINYYQNPQRFPLPIHTQQGQTGYVAAFPQNYLPQTNQPPPPPPPQTTDLVPVFPSQQVQVVYSTPPQPPLPATPVMPAQQQQQNPSNALIYPNQPNIVYTQNPIYPTTVYHPSQQQYPQNTPTPNGCTSSFTTEQQQQQQQANVMQITQNLAQMNFLSHQQFNNNNPNFNKIMPSSHDYCRQKVNLSKNNNGKFNNSSTTKFVMNSSQCSSNSTGTNSPATTVLAGYCPQQNIYRTPPDTPPTTTTQFGYGANYQLPPPAPPPMLFRQMSNVRANTPGTNRSSRSPTPASDIQHFDKQRIALAAPPPPPTIYHGMPYVIQSNDNRIIPGRGPPNAYRQPSLTRQQQQQQQQHRYRKSK